MPLRSDWSEMNCPIARGLDALGDPWVLLILREALCGVRRFDDFRKILGAADNILTTRLKKMVKAGLLRRVAYTEGKSPKYEYVPTKAGTEALPILHAFARWAETHARKKDVRAFEIVCRNCGRRSSTGESCSECGKPLTAASVTWIRGGKSEGRRIDLVSGE
jgi:DNA-binding HxlR family transcriptional regulator